MIREKFPHLDSDDTEVEREYCFNLTPVEIAEWSAEYPDGIGEYLQKLGESKNLREMMWTMRDIIGRSVGQRKPSGAFVKDPEFVQEFMSGDAYSSLIIVFWHDEPRLRKFVNGIFPKNIAEKFGQPKKTYSNDELLTMDEAQFIAVASDNGRLPERDWDRRYLLLGMQRNSQGRAA